MSKTGKDVTWNRLFGSDPNFAKDEKGRTISSDYDRGYADALDAAEAAVANIQGPLYSVRNSGDAQQGWDAHSRHAVAAIRALKEKP